MPIVYTPPGALTRPAQTGTSGSVTAQIIEEYTGVVESTLRRKSILEGFIPVQHLQGTNTMTNFGVGQAALQKLVPGQRPDPTVTAFGKRTLTVDTPILARNTVPLLEDFITKYSAREEIGYEQGKLIGKTRDQAFLIQAMKAALLTDTSYSGLSGQGHAGGSRQTQATANDHLDPALLYANIVKLLVRFEEKDVDPLMDDLICVVRPAEYATLEQNELLINRQMITSDGNSVMQRVLKARGIPVMSTNNLLTTAAISGHILSDAVNSNAFDGDFTKVVAVIFSPRALMAGSVIPLTTNVWFNDEYKQWNIDAWEAYSVGPNRAEFAGVVLKP